MEILELPPTHNLRPLLQETHKPTPTNKTFLFPAVEERRIVYVGRIEEETTKEDLKRKFLAYGSIKQITIHYKDNG